MLSAFSPPTRSWFEQAFAAPTPVQERGWAAIQSGQHSLMLAPTGSGKTLAAFLWSIDRLLRLPQDADEGVRVLYISPLKALVYDVERNLRAPLIGIRRVAEGMGHDLRPLRHSVRTGDTSQRDRRSFGKHPPEIFITTPESLYLVLTSQAREALRSVHTVIIDEIHTMAGTKRGAHLAVSLERLCRITDVEPQRIGLSATQRPLSAIAGYLGGDRAVEIVDASEPPDLDLQIVVPVQDMERPWLRPPDKVAQDGPDNGTISVTYEGKDDKSIWPAIHPRLLELIRAHHSTILFTNSRILCEKLANRLNELAGEELVLAHHGSIAHERRTTIEEMLKRGDLKALVATSSLELGIDMGAVDLVIQVESPGSVAAGLQRVGRAGHGVGERSVGRIFPKYRGDLLEAAAVARDMLRGRIESTRIPQNPLDVLAQQIVAMVGMDDWQADELLLTLRRASNYRGLSSEVFHAVLDMLSGRHSSEALAELRPRLVWDRDTDLLTARKGAKMLAILNGGTIPDRGLFPVHLGPGGPKIGELDEEMVHESRRGHAFILGASTWKIEEISRDRVTVSPAPGMPARMPFWRGQGPGRPAEMGRALGAFVRELDEQEPDQAVDWLMGSCPVDELAARNLLAFVQDQRAATGALPTDSTIVVERFRDELGDWRVCILSPFGSRIHAPWALAIEGALTGEAGFEVQALWTDDGIVLRFADTEELPDLSLLLPDPDEVKEQVLEQLDRSALFSGIFREAAARALLLPRRRPGKRTPLWAQRLRSQTLLAEVRRQPGFPIVLETYRECLQDVFDLPGLVELLGRVRSRDLRVVEAETPTASPFARSLVFAYVAAYLYEGDAPLAERKAQALSLDRALLRELLGQEELRDLLDADALALVELELQRLTPERQARDADDLQLMLRSLGALSLDELRARCTEDPQPWLEQLRSRVVRVRVSGEERWIAAEDAPRYRDALGVVLPPGLPAAFLEGSEQPLRDLVVRYGRTHGPFLTRDVAARLGLLPAQVEPVLREQLRLERLVLGELRPGGIEREWCDPEVLRRIRRRSLAALRQQIAAVEASALGRFLPRWHGVGGKRRGQARLEEVIDQLEGLALPFSEWERRVLPARVADFNPRMLDEMGASGQLVWVGRGALGPRDGRIMLLRRESVPQLVDALPDPQDLGPLQRAVLGHLEQRGASFFSELLGACGAPNDELLEAVWDLAWSGRISNDTFQPLRGLGQTRRKTASPGRGLRRRSGAARTAGGRWSLVSSLAPGTAPTTERMHSRAVVLLERYGVVSREAAKAEDLAGGFTTVYPLLRSMEEVGRIRRGWFVEGLGGAQFALAGAVDALRADDKGPRALMLAAMDPANPYGALLPWPEGPGQASPRRAAGCSVLVHLGEPLLWLSRNGRSAVSFPGADEPERLLEALGVLETGHARFFDRSLLIEQLDGGPPASSPLAPTFVRAGFQEEGDCLRLALL
jgi:ATP-dependent Lhr-like helicase